VKPVKIKIDPEAWKKDLKEGFTGSVSNWWRAIGTLTVGFLAFSLTILSANPQYSWQMLNSGVEFWGIAFITRLSGVLATSGYTGVSLTALFSILVGVSMTNTVIQLRMNQLDLSSLGALPGFLAGGCASCGVGVLSLLGFGGVMASMPYQGNSLRLAAVILLMALIIRTGNPDSCKLN
jgi:hypothetical protein